MMRARDLHPEIRRSIRWTPRIPFAQRTLLPLSRALYNAGAGTKLPPAVRVSRETQAGVDVLVFESEVGDADGAILWMFGGGHLAGKPEHLNALAGLTVRELGVRVYVPNYRLAPAHPFPADLDDCYAVWQWLSENGQERGINPHRLAIAGNSAGGGLAAALAQLIVDEGGVQPIAQCLFYPMLDDRRCTDRSLDAIDHFVWNNRANFEAWRAYLKPHEPGAISLPAYAAPARRERLTGLPPAWIGMCELDLFYPEYAEYARRLKADGVLCDIHEAAGAPHAFEVFKPNATISRGFQNSAIQFLKKMFVNHAT